MLVLFVWFDSLHPINNLSVKQGQVFLGWISTKLGYMCLAQGPQRSDSGEAGPRGPSVWSLALYHWATALPLSIFEWLLYTGFTESEKTFQTLQRFLKDVHLVSWLKAHQSLYYTLILFQYKTFLDEVTFGRIMINMYFEGSQITNS